jgi:hypothetical protein
MLVDILKHFLAQQKTMQISSVDFEFFAVFMFLDERATQVDR